MEFLLNTANPLTILLYTAILVLIILFSKKTIQIWSLAITLVLMLLMLLYHSITLDMLSCGSGMINQTYHCIAFDLIAILLNFISLLWIDDLLAKKKKIKSYDDSLSWFWNKL